MYAQGKKALGICDRCGFRYDLSELKKEWNNLKTCPECFESKHPQLEPRTHKADAQAIREPRPDTSFVPRAFTVYTNYDLGIIGKELTTPNAMATSLGIVTITTS